MIMASLRKITTSLSGQCLLHQHREVVSSPLSRRNATMLKSRASCAQIMEHLGPQLAMTLSARALSFCCPPIMSKEFMEEELEWLTNKDAFSSVDESCFRIFSNDFGIFSDTQSSVSALDKTSFSFSNTNVTSIGSYHTSFKVPTSYPIRARTKRRRRVNFKNFHYPWLARVNRNKWNLANVTTKDDGIRCLHCQTEKTPQWRAGPMGPKTLCNACGVRYMSSRLLAEYRPANSPTFCSALHSNSHKKVVEMRRQMQQGNNVLRRI